MIKKKLIFLFVCIGSLAAYYGFKSDKMDGNAQSLHFKIDSETVLVTSKRIGINLKSQEEIPEEKVEALKTLKPAFLRFEGNLDPYFLRLCKNVQANPWIALPSDLEADRYSQIGKTLAENAAFPGFSEVFVEIGKLPEDKLKKALKTLVDNAGSQVNLKTLLRINEEEVVLSNVQTLPPDIDYVAIDAETLIDKAVLKTIAMQAFRFGKSLAAYQTKSESMPAIGWQMIGANRFKIQPQLVLDNKSNYEAVKLMNKAMNGTSHKLNADVDSMNPAEVLGVAFNTTTKWSIAIASKAEKETRITIEFPNDNRTMPNQILILDQQNRMQTAVPHVKERSLFMTLPPNSFAVLPPSDYFENYDRDLSSR